MTSSKDDVEARIDPLMSFIKTVDVAPLDCGGGDEGALSEPHRAMGCPTNSVDVDWEAAREHWRLSGGTADGPEWRLFASGIKYLARAEWRRQNHTATPNEEKPEDFLSRAYDVWTKAYYSDSEDRDINMTRFFDLLGMEKGSSRWPDDAFLSPHVPLEDEPTQPQGKGG